jgi:hypothetical protein
MEARMAMMAITINSSMRVNVDRHERFNGVSRYFTDTSLHESVMRNFPLLSTRFGCDKLGLTRSSRMPPYWGGTQATRRMPAATKIR